MAAICGIIWKNKEFLGRKEAYMTPIIKFPALGLFKTEGKIHNIPIDKIRQSPYQPRKMPDSEEIYDLSRSIRACGVLQPILVRSVSKGYELVSGSRRLRAVRLAGMDAIPAIIIQAAEFESATLALIENIQTLPLDLFEEAEAFESIMQYYGLDEDELAAKIGRNRAYVTNKLKLLKLTPDVRRLILQNGLTERHARAIAKIPDEAARLEAAVKIAEKDLNAASAEAFVEESMNCLRDKRPMEGERAPARHETVRVSDMRLFTNSIKQSVDIMKKSGLDTTYETMDKDGVYEINIKVRQEQGN